MKTKKISTIWIILFAVALFINAGAKTSFSYEGTVILCYHDVPKQVYLDNFGSDQKSFINTIEYFKAHGFIFISLNDFIEAKKGKKELPSKTILLSFDDAYESFYEFVYPILKEYKIPSTLAVVTSWIEGDVPPEYVNHTLMNWDQIREVAKSEYVEVIAHSHDLHKGILYNPQGNKASSAVSRLYDAQSDTYETEEQFIVRIEKDLNIAKKLLEDKTGRTVRVLAWPYGLYNALSQEIARKAGFTTQFTLNDKMVLKNKFDVENRFIIYKNPTVQTLLKNLKLVDDGYESKRIVQIDLDMIHDPNPEQTERNLGALLDRIKDLKVTAVYLQAFADEKGSGNIEEVYFPNRVLPMKADIFNRVVHQLKTRTEVKVFAWMPMLSYQLPKELKEDDFYVHDYVDGEIQLTSSWYARLSPFNKRVKTILTQLYEDMAVHANVDGIIFQDDGYLNNEEDFSPAALDEYKVITSSDEFIPPEEIDEVQQKAWIRIKTDALNVLSVHLMDSVERFRPEIKTARTLYAPVVITKKNESVFAQSYKESLGIYDEVVVMVYPKLEGVKRPTKWLKKLVELVKKEPEGIRKTVFKIQTYDWKNKRWIREKTLNKWLKTLVLSGARHVAYYPDDYIKNHPDIKQIKEMMSVEDFPFKRDWK